MKQVTTFLFIYIFFSFISNQKIAAQDYTLEIRGLNPHVGQLFQLRAVNKLTGEEAGRISIAEVDSADFDLDLSFLEDGESYYLDFFADHNGNGLYDEPSTDHAWRLEVEDVQKPWTLTFNHNTNFTDIKWNYLLTLEFTGMVPHVGQKLSARVYDAASRKEVGRTILDTIPSADFSINIPGIELRKNYYVDFFADHSGNGLYDSPSTDHAWRKEFITDTGNVTIGFAHNTNFTDIGWKYQLTMNFTGMVPHVGQKLSARVYDAASRKEVERKILDAILGPDFTITIPGLEAGKNYYVDFFADHNGNGMYDAPSADHAWREEFNTDSGDAVVEFAHNTNFTDLEWKYELALNFSNMVPHIGQTLNARVLEKGTYREVSRFSIPEIPGPDFQIYLQGLEASKNYYVDFYADHNGNGLYDAPSTDHAWREEFSTDNGDASVDFSHNTNFTDIQWKYQAVFNLEGMVPHVGQKFEARVYDTGSNTEVARVKVDEIPQPDFTLYLPGLSLGENYNLDFYADHNGNGIYDAPSADHAWRVLFNTENGDATVEFAHNTNFTDVGWKYQLAFNLISMTPHVGQYFEVRVIDNNTNTEVGRKEIDAIPQADFSIYLGGLDYNTEYRADFYADFNGSSSYDAPPIDHAWREIFTNENGDTELDFSHNTNFSDIEITTGVEIEEALNELPKEYSLSQNYPNPFNPTTNIKFSLVEHGKVSIQIYNAIGQLVEEIINKEFAAGTYNVTWNAGNTPSGVYFYSITSNNFRQTKKMLLLK